LNFVFVDKIMEMIPGKTIRATKFILEDEEIFEVHFPGFPVVPGVFLTEMMAQTAGKCLDAERNPRGKAMLARVKSAAFRKYVGPGQEAIISAEILVNRDSFATAKCSIEVKSERISTAELFFAFLPYVKLAPDYRDEVLESFLSAAVL
jgi:3-hydroxyacyl-[acyl-carrier-protein] dehydratase